MRRVLVLGAGGFIGSALCRRLMDDGNVALTMADVGFGPRTEETFPDPAERARIRFITADFASPSAYGLLDDQYDQVYHLAALVGVNRTLARPDEVIRVNTALVLHTLEWLQRATVGRLLFASSSENYAATTDLFGAPVPTPETVPLTIGDIKHPRWTYALTKILGESAFLQSAGALGFEATIVRYQNAFGPAMGFRHAIPHIIQRVLDGESPVRVYGADQTRAFCYVTDSVDGTVRAMNTPAAAGEIYHVGNDEEITMRQLTEAVGALLGYEGAYEDAPTYPGSVERRCPDISKCRRDLGYAPQVSWREGLARTVEWYRAYFASGRRPVDGGFEPPEKFAAGAR
jgi:nucleoside-diphosphate-sugar epimerase